MSNVTTEANSGVSPAQSDAPAFFVQVDHDGIIQMISGVIEHDSIIRVGSHIRDVFGPEVSDAYSIAIQSNGTEHCIEHEFRGDRYDSRLSILKSRTGDVLGGVIFSTAMSPNLRSERILDAIVEGTVSYTESKFFESLAMNIAKSLDVPYVLVTECKGNPPSSLQTLAVWFDGQPKENFEYSVRATPCEHVIHQGPQFFSKGIQQAFPEDQDLVDMSVEGYFGMPLYGEDDHVLGHIALLTKKPMDPEVPSLRVLQLFAERASAELLRIRSLHAIRENQEQTNAILHNHVDAVVIVYPNDQIAFANKCFCSLAKTTSVEEMHRFSDCFSVDSISSDCMGQVNASDGSVFPVEFQQQPIHYQGAEAQLYVMRDISLRLQAESDCEILRSQLSRVGRLGLMGEMANGISHEVNQPLTAIANYANTMRLELRGQQPPSFDAIMDTLDEIEEQAIQAGRVIRGFRALAQVSSPVHQSIRVNQLIHDLSDLLRPSARSRDVRLELRLADELPLIQGDPTEIQQVIVNLVLHSIEDLRHSKLSYKEITVETKYEASERVYIRVSHGGEDVSPSYAADLFEPFDTRNPDDFQLGMSICRAILDTHQGEISAHPLEGGGIVYELWIPLNPLPTA